MDQRDNISVLKGEILTEVKRNLDYEITFVTYEGKAFKMYHEQNCCECVQIEDVAGDLNDLIGHPIITAEERTSHTRTKEQELERQIVGEDTYDHQDESNTWTFYELATIKGSVTIRWWGSSNGYYSESVDFMRLK